MSRQFINIDEIRKSIAALHVGDKIIDAWLDKKILRHISTAAVPLYPVYVLGSDRPEWMQKAYKAGNLFVWNVQDLVRDHREIIDWFEHLHDNDPKLYARIPLMNYQQALDGTRKWHRALKETANDKGIDQTIKGQQTVFVSGDYRWVKLTTAAALTAEGSAMGHCVAAYARRVTGSGSTAIYSLRDKNNAPHVTMEVFQTKAMKSARIRQVKGKCNDGPTEVYRRLVIDFVRNVGPDWRWDEEAISDMDAEGSHWNGVDFVGIEEITPKRVVDWADAVYIHCAGKQRHVKIVKGSLVIDFASNRRSIHHDLITYRDGKFSEDYETFLFLVEAHLGLMKNFRMRLYDTYVFNARMKLHNVVYNRGHDKKERPFITLKEANKAICLGKWHAPMCRGR